MNSAIRHLSTTFGDHTFAAAEFENRIHIYRLGNSSPERVIYSHLDGGGYRMQIVPRKGIVVAGAYHVHGIEGFCLKTGRRLWQRKDLKKLQKLRWNPKDNSVSCFFEDRAGVVLDASTGRLVSSYRGVKDVYFSPNGAVSLEDARPRYRLIHKGILGSKVPAESFAILDVAFSNEFVAVSEVAASVRMFSLSHGELVGAYKPPRGFHVLRISYDPSASQFIALLWGYEKAAGYSLLHLSHTGHESYRVELETAYVSTFTQERRSILLGSGRELSWRIGNPVFRYDFPKQSDETA